MLSLESESLLAESPGPMVEIKFWEAKCLNLECLHEQVNLLPFVDIMRILYKYNKKKHFR